MNKTNIEWVKNPDGSQGYTLNSKTGCTNNTTEGLCLGGLFPCYAYRLAHGRLKERYLNNTKVAIPPFSKGWASAINDPFFPRLWAERIKEPYQVKKPVGFFLDDMSDWMLDCWPEEWTEAELQMMRDNPQHRIYTLTKQSQNLAKWSPFPDNCWVGITACNFGMMDEALIALGDIKAPIKYISIEPFLGEIPEPHYTFKPEVDWLIIGACTGRKAEIFELCQGYPELTPMPYGRIWTAQPKIEWVEEIVRAADQAGIPVFLKDNLEPLLEKAQMTYEHTLYWRDGYYTSPDHPNVDLHLRQEMPVEGG
jgi:protein gp37